MLFVGIGLLFWLTATIAFRLIGQFLLDPTNLALMTGVFLATPFLMLIMMLFVYRWQQVSIHDRSQAALLVALPGMLLDVGSVLFFPAVFPNIDPTANVLFAALMLWGYASVLLSGSLQSIDQTAQGE